MKYDNISVKPPKGPMLSVRKGQFEVSVWSSPVYRESPERRSVPWRLSEDYRACVQFTVCDERFRHWDVQQIWCSVRELEGLKKALAEMDGGQE